MLTFPEMLLRLGQFVQTSSTLSNVASIDISTASYCSVSRRKINYNFYAISSSLESESFKSYHLSGKRKISFGTRFTTFLAKQWKTGSSGEKGIVFSIAWLMDEF